MIKTAQTYNDSIKWTVLGWTFIFLIIIFLIAVFAMNVSHAESYTDDFSDDTEWTVTTGHGILHNEFVIGRTTSSYSYSTYNTITGPFTEYCYEIDVKNNGSSGDMIAYIGIYKDSNNKEAILFHLGDGQIYKISDNTAAVYMGVIDGYTSGNTYRLRILYNESHYIYIYIDGVYLTSYSKTLDSDVYKPYIGSYTSGTWANLDNFYFNTEDIPQSPAVTHDPAGLYVYASDLATGSSLYDVGYTLTNVELSQVEYGYFDQWKYWEIDTNYTYTIETNATYYIDWGPFTMTAAANNQPGYEWHWNATMARAVEDPVNQSYTKIYFEDQDGDPVNTVWLKITNESGTILERYVGQYWYITLQRGGTYTFECADTLARHQGSIRTVTIPDQDQTEIPMIMITTIEEENVFLDKYISGIDNSTQLVRDGFNTTFGPIYGLLDNYTEQITTVAENVTSANGTIAGYTATITALGGIVNTIPMKVQFVITYFLILLLVLVVFNR